MMVGYHYNQWFSSVQTFPVSGKDLKGLVLRHSGIKLRVSKEEAAFLR